jgi:broad specificity phosphatase PhoE
MQKRNYASLKLFMDELAEPCLLLARHGETDWNAMNIIQGQQDRPLSITGFEQRRNLFLLLNPISITRICCSTLQRTLQTAIPIGFDNKIPIEQYSDLNEVGLGIFEGQHKEHFSDEVSRRCYQAFLDDEVNTVLPGGGESLRMVDQRVQGVVADCLDTVERSGHVLIVGHRNVNKMIIKNLLGLSLDEGYQVEHKNDWLYIFEPKQVELYRVHVSAPQETIQVNHE